MIKNQEPVHIDNALGIRATQKALLVGVPDGEVRRELWVPLSQIDEDSEVYDEETNGTLVITAWFARREGLDR